MPCREDAGWWGTMGILGVAALLTGWLLSLLTEWALLRMKNQRRKAS